MTAFAALAGPAPVARMGSGEGVSANFGPVQHITDAANATTQFIARQQNTAPHNNGQARSAGSAADTDPYDDLFPGLITGAALDLLVQGDGYGALPRVIKDARYGRAQAQPRAPPSRG